LPMVFSTGAGSEMRSVMGIAVFSGMLGVTFFGLFFTPMFYVLLRKLEGKRSYAVAEKVALENVGHQVVDHKEVQV
jgi:multidrug efflux pump